MEDAVSITTMKGGAVVEMLDFTLQKVLANIADINTTLAAREINLIKLKPSDDRTIITISIDCTHKLCGQEPVQVNADLLFEKGKHFARERVPPQQSLFENVTPIKKEGSND